MARNGSGVYSLPAGNPVVTLTAISSAWANGTMTDLGNEITNSIDRSGRTVALANLPMGGFKHTGASDANATGQYLNYGQAGAVLDGLSITTTLTGAGVTARFASPGPIGNTAASTVAATTFTGAGTGLTGTGASFTAGSTNALSGTALGTNVTYTANFNVNNIGTAAVTSVGQSGNLACTGSAANPATMSFHRLSTYGLNMGLDTDNVFRLGGWSDGAQSRWTADSSGNFVARGNVTAFSDLRIKKNIRRITGAVLKVNALRGVTFDRTDKGNDGLRSTGVIAQEVQAVLPEAVREGDDGMLTVAYGNLAGLLIEAVKELSKRTVALESRV